MIKTYKFNAKMNSIRIILQGKSGNNVVYQFSNGNILTNTPARVVISGAYEQELLEGSDAFKSGIVRLERVEKTEEELIAERKKKEKEEEDAMEQVAEVTNVNEAISYIADKFGLVAKNAKEAKAIAKQNKIAFPNLKSGKNA